MYYKYIGIKLLLNVVHRLLFIVVNDYAIKKIRQVDGFLSENFFY